MAVIVVCALLGSGSSSCDAIVDDLTTQTVRSQVVDVETGEPIGGASVEAGDYRKTFSTVACNIIKPPCSDREFIPEAETVTRADGTFALDDLSLRATHLRVLPPPPPDPHRPIYFGAIVEVGELENDIQLQRQGRQR